MTTAGGKIAVHYNLHGSDGGSGGTATGAVRRPVEWHPSGDQPNLAAQLGTRDSLLRVPPEIRKIIYTTNAVESLHMTLRKVIKTRAAFPHEQAAFKLLQNVAKKWNSVQGWREALNRFQILWPERMPPLERG